MWHFSYLKWYWICWMSIIWPQNCIHFPLKSTIYHSRISNNICIMFIFICEQTWHTYLAMCSYRHNQNDQFNLHIKDMYIYNKHVPRYTYKFSNKHNVLKSFILYICIKTIMCLIKIDRTWIKPHKRMYFALNKHFANKLHRHFIEIMCVIYLEEFSTSKHIFHQQKMYEHNSSNKLTHNLPIFQFVCGLHSLTKIDIYVTLNIICECVWC